MSDEWRIDELAQRSGLSVDTIRFYQREGLLRPGRRKGRVSVYGPAHLHQLERIRDLQARHFSLGAIKALSDEGRLSVVEALFSSGARSYDRQQLEDESGLDARLLDELERAGLPSSPGEHGAESYEPLDLQVLQAVAGLLALGMPERTVLALVRIYTDHFLAMQADVVKLFSGDEEGGTLSREMRDFRLKAPGQIESLMALVQTILNYSHHRAVQQIALRSLEQGAIDVQGDEPHPSGPGSA